MEILKKRGIRTCTLDELSREKADIVVECTGAPSGLKTAFALVHPRGTIVLKSTYAELPKLDLSPVVINEITVVGSRCGPFPPAIRFLEQGGIDTVSLISRRFPLGKGVNALKAAKRSDALKVVLDIG
jgi:threonine dehydrogenase-like Zn-dependent dehydrogenase